MKGEKGGYKSIVKSTLFFGGVKIIQVFLNLLRGKIIAILLGPTGVGYNGLYVSTITMVNNFTGLGLNFSAVRNISKSKESGDIVQLSRTIRVYKNLLFFISFLGFVVVIGLSGFLSKSTFGSAKYTLMFIFLGLMIFFNTLSAGNASLLQGTRSLAGYAKHILTGSTAALLVSAPFYYFFGLKGIVPSLIVSSFITYLFSIYYTSKIEHNKIRVSLKETISEGSEMVKLGVAMMVVTSLTSLANYLTNIYIQSTGSIIDFGLYQAGMSITLQSIGLVFASMAIDYYPRLVAVCDNPEKLVKMVNNQAEVMLLIATPILVLLMIVAPVAIKILLSAEFLPIVGFIRLLSIGMVFKSATYAIGAISFAKGDKKTFFLLEGIYTNSAIVIFSVAGYYLGGLIGVGYGFAIMHALYFIIITFVNRRLYSYKPSKHLLTILSVQIISVLIVYTILNKFNGIFSYLISSIFFLLTASYSLYTISKSMDVKESILKVFKKA